MLGCSTGNWGWAQGLGVEVLCPLDEGGSLAQSLPGISLSLAMGACLSVSGLHLLGAPSLRPAPPWGPGGYPSSLGLEPACPAQPLALLHPQFWHLAGQSTQCSLSVALRTPCSQTLLPAKPDREVGGQPWAPIPTSSKVGQLSGLKTQRLCQARVCPDTAVAQGGCLRRCLGGGLRAVLPLHRPKSAQPQLLTSSRPWWWWGEGGYLGVPLDPRVEAVCPWPLPPGQTPAWALLRLLSSG